MSGIRRTLTRKDILDKCGLPTCMKPAAFKMNLLLYAGEKGEHGPLTLDSGMKLCADCRLTATPEKVVSQEVWDQLLQLWRQDPKAMLPVRSFTKLDFKPIIHIARA